MVPEQEKTTRINSTIDSTLEKKFREMTFKEFGYKKGSIQKGLEDAISTWIKTQKEREKRSKL
jgi:hypothetical protein